MVKTEQLKKVTKTTEKKKIVWPKVIVGSHSTRTEYENGRVDFITDWKLLEKDVQNAITSYESTLNATANNNLTNGRQ